MYQPPTTRPLPYAPSSHSHQNLHPTTTIPLDTELKPFSTPLERDHLDSLAELYSIIVTLDGLERAYQKDALDEATYTRMAGKMLAQYRSLLADTAVAEQFGDLDAFMRSWELEAPRAAETLRSGLMMSEVYVSGTGNGGAGNRNSGYQQVSNGSQAGNNGGNGGGSGGGGGLSQVSGALILQATENFITFLDALRLNLLSKSQLHPILSDVIQSVNKVTDRDFEGRGKIIQWLITLNQLKAAEELDVEQASQCAFDLETAYGGFKGLVSQG